MNPLLIVLFAIGGFVLTITIVVILINMAKKFEPEGEDCDISGCSHCISVTKCKMPSAEKYRKEQPKAAD